MINAENAAYHSEKFMTMARRTRHEYLKDLATNYLTETTLDAPQKFCESSPPPGAGTNIVELPCPVEHVLRKVCCFYALFTSTVTY